MMRILIAAVIMVLLSGGAPVVAAGESKNDSLFVIYQGGKAGYMDRTGKIVIPPRFDGATGFREGLAPMKVGEKWGVIDQQGKMVASPQFEKVWDYAEGLALVRVQKMYGFIDRQGKIVIQPQFRWAGNFGEGLAPVAVDGKCGYIDQSGTMILPPKYEAARSFSEGLAPVKTNGKWGYIDQSGKMVIKPRFDSAAPFRHGLAEIGIGGQPDVKFGFINRQGKLIIPLQPFGEIFFSEGLIAMPDNHDKWGFRDTLGTWVIPPRFDLAYAFHEGLASVMLIGKYGFIDRTGKMVIPPQYDGVEKGFSEGLAGVEVQGKWGYIDQKGNLVIPAQFDRVWKFRHGLGQVIQGEIEGYINKTGEFVWPASGPKPQGHASGQPQSSSEKPPEKKENLTFEDRQAWQKILNWPEPCGHDPEDLAGLPPENSSGLRFWQLEPKKYLVEVTCMTSAYNKLVLFICYDETTSPPSSQIVSFEEYDQLAKTIRAPSEPELLGDTEVHPQTKELTLWCRARWLGDCGMWFKYRITKNKGILLEVRAKECVDDPNYDGIAPEPATYPLIFRRPAKFKE